MEQAVTHTAPRDPTGRTGVAAARQVPARSATTAPAVLALVFVAMCIPGIYNIAGLAITPGRLVLLLLFVPCLAIWAGRKAGGILKADILFLLFGGWMLVTFLVNNGLARLPYASMNMIEMFGAYLIGRVLIRSVADYRLFFRFHLILLLIILPFVIPEMLTSRAYLLEMFNDLTGHSWKDLNHDARMGLNRAQAMFPHPIMLGVFASVGVANAIFLYRGGARLFGFGLSLFMAFASLSSGPFLSSILQVLILLWGKLTGRRWKLLAWIAVGLFVFLELTSDRGPFILMIEYLTFNSSTGWTRVKQFDFGFAEVRRNPIFGLGLNNWRRPFWLGASVDNFWLLNAMRHGAVGFLLLAGAVLLMLRSVVTAQGLSDEAAQLRTGYVTGLVSVIITLFTVHVWGSTGILVMMYFGAGAVFVERAVASGPPGRRRPKVTDLPPPDLVPAEPVRTARRRRPDPARARS